MPTYEYACRNMHCEHLDEVLSVQRTVAERNDPCACTCGMPMQRVISSTSFSLRGGGWARDGYSQKRSEED